MVNWAEFDTAPDSGVRVGAVKVDTAVDPPVPVTVVVRTPSVKSGAVAETR
jgi:hypothetical protein